MQEEYQDIVTRLKKADSFNQRRDYDEYLHLIWKVQADIMLKIIGWVRHENIGKIDIYTAFTNVHSQVSSVIEYLQSKEPLKVFKEKKFRLYLFQRNKKYYCMDLISSKIFQVSDDVLYGLRIFMSDQFMKVSPKILKNIKTLEENGLIHPVKQIKTEPLNLDEITDLAWEIFQNHKIDTMAERYFWE